VSSGSKKASRWSRAPTSWSIANRSCALHSPPSEASSRAQADHPLFGREQVLVIAGTLVAIAIAYWTMRNIPLDALPDLSEHAGHRVLALGSQPRHHRGSGLVPIITALLGAPKVKAIRGYSDFGFSYVYVIFEDGTDIYWAHAPRA